MEQDSETIGYKPLYAHIRDRLVRRLVDGSWTPGMLIPSETELARQLNVSQGTVRKALDTMTGDNLLVRRQGRGTFVAQPEDSRILFQFFRLVPDDHPSAFPQSTVLAHSRGRASAAEARELALERGDGVIRIERLRLLAKNPVLVETVVLPSARFPDFPDAEDVPNNIYQLFSTRWGITIAQAEEQLRAAPASAEDAARLGCEQGRALLVIHRVARDLEGRAVEFRLSRCLTDRAHYAVSLR